MKKERLFYLDFVRAIAAISIVITHFNARYLYLNPPMPEKAVITTTVSNIYIGAWGVSLFFIISGAALMYVYEEKCELKVFYKKRFLNIYPMFWIAYFFAFCYLFYTNKMVPGVGAPKVNFLFTILGFDGLLAENIPTFYILGEWFLGAIILMYLIFPILRSGINKRPLLTWIIILILYGWMIVGYHYNFNSSKIILTRLPEIVFGMCFVKNKAKVNWKIAVTSIVLLIANSVIKPEWSMDLQTTYVGILSFLFLVYVSYFVKEKWSHAFCGLVSKYSYAIFLVHHVIIAKMMSTFDLGSMSKLHSYALFVTICIVISFFAGLLYELHGRMMKFITCMSEKNDHSIVGKS